MSNFPQSLTTSLTSSLKNRPFLFLVTLTVLLTNRALAASPNPGSHSKELGKGSYMGNIMLQNGLSSSPSADAADEPEVPCTELTVEAPYELR
jgi:hypothetical protein